MKLSKILVASSALTAVAVSAYAAGVDSLTVVSWGGAYQESQQKAYTNPYGEEHGINFVYEEAGGDAPAKLRAQAEAGDVTYDLVDVTAGSAIALCDEGIARPIDADADLADGADGSKASADFGDLLVSECFIPQIVYSTTWGYRNDVAEWNGNEPTEICDVFDTETFPGKRAIQDSYVNNMEWGAYCAGVPKDEIYASLETAEGQQAALDMWSTIKDDLVFWNAGADTPQLLADGEVVMGSTYNGRLFEAINVNAAPINMLWDGQVFDLDGWVIPANLPAEREAAVLDLVKEITDTQHLADQAKYISYGPARLSSAPLVGKHVDLGIEMGPQLPTDPANAGNTILTNYEFQADFGDELADKWKAWAAQ